MDNDLVKRLRGEAEKLEWLKKMGGADKYFVALISEASGEIERLRAQNEELKNLYTDSSEMARQAIAIAKASQNMDEPMLLEIERMHSILRSDEQTIRQHLGEMTPQEMRNVKAAFAWVLSHDR